LRKSIERTGGREAPAADRPAGPGIVLRDRADPGGHRQSARAVIAAASPFANRQRGVLPRRERAQGLRPRPL